MADVYSIYNSSDDLLYIGATVNLRRRMQQHRASQPWSDQIHRVEIEECPSLRHAHEREKELIKQRKPLYNVVNNLGTDEMVPVFLRVPTSLRKQMRVQAAYEDRSMNRVGVDAFVAYLKANPYEEEE